MKNLFKKLLRKPIATDSRGEKSNFQPVPAVLLDFEQQAIGEEHPQDPFYGLQILHRQLVIAAHHQGYQLYFPLYEFACAWFLKQKGKLTTEYVNKLNRIDKLAFPTEEIFLLGGIAGFINALKFIPLFLGIPNFFGMIPSLITIAASTINFLKKYKGGDLTIGYLEGRGLQREDLEKVMSLDPDKELLDALPTFFAADLKEAMKKANAPPKIVLFFDSHETFWGDWRNCGEARFFKQDEWFRCLLAQLDLSKIVVVVAGREEPRWHEANQCPISQDQLELKEVLNFPTQEALRYLDRVGIKDKDLCKRLINYAHLENDLVHPLFLGLCADIVRASEVQGITLADDDLLLTSESEQKFRLLVERLLKYVDDDIRNAVDALTACRAFNQELFLKLGQSLDFQATQAAFNYLIGFSFVWHAKNWGQDWYRIHPLVRRLNAEKDLSITQSAHAWLEQYYRQQGNLSEAIYHAIFQDWRRGVQEWLTVFQNATDKENFELCRTLETIRKDLFF